MYRGTVQMYRSNQGYEGRGLSLIDPSHPSDPRWRFKCQIGKLKYLKVQNGNKDTWRFWCDSNANGIFDENEKFILDDPSKDNAEIGPRQDSK